MYKKILIATDGSTVSEIAALAGVRFAREIAAGVVGFCAAPPYEFPAILGVPYTYPSESEYAEQMRALTHSYLDVIKRPIEAVGLEFEAATPLTNAPAFELVEAARCHGCDLIFMGSHGRGGFGRLLLGSVTTKVLSSCHIPVLVYRPTEEEAARAETA